MAICRRRVVGRLQRRIWSQPGWIIRTILQDLCRRTRLDGRWILISHLKTSINPHRHIIIICSRLNPRPSGTNSLVKESAIRTIFSTSSQSSILIEALTGILGDKSHGEAPTAINLIRFAMLRLRITFSTHIIPILTLNHRLITRAHQHRPSIQLIYQDIRNRVGDCRHHPPLNRSRLPLVRTQEGTTTPFTIITHSSTTTMTPVSLGSDSKAILTLRLIPSHNAPLP